MRPACSSARGSGYLGAALAVAGVILFASGAWIHWSDESVPRMTVIGGRVLVDGQPARLNSRLPVGATVSIDTRGDALTLLCGENRSLTLSGPGSLTHLGRRQSGRAYRLVQGTLFVRNAEAGGRIEVESDLGRIRSGTGVFELLATAVQGGIAMDTPRILRLSVARGTVQLTPAGGAQGAEFVPAGVKAELQEGLDRVRACSWLSPEEWKQMIGHLPGYADADTSVAEIPAGLWVPRKPGSKGATPGSVMAPDIRYAPKLRAIVLVRGDRKSVWQYRTADDRWQRVERPAVPAASHASTPPPVPPPGSAGSVARSTLTGAYLFYGRVQGRAETWTLPAGGRQWRRVDAPANPPPRTAHGLCYDPEENIFLLFGGECRGRIFDDLWVFRLESRQRDGERARSAG